MTSSYFLKNKMFRVVWARRSASNYVVSSKFSHTQFKVTIFHIKVPIKWSNQGPIAAISIFSFHTAEKVEFKMARNLHMETIQYKCNWSLCGMSLDRPLSLSHTHTSTLSQNAGEPHFPSVYKNHELSTVFIWSKRNHLIHQPSMERRL